MKRREKAALVAAMAGKGFDFVVRQDVDPKELGAELRRLRENCVVSASDLAERMGWNTNNLLRLERGGAGREPTITSVNLYLRMLGFELVLAARPKRPPRTRRSGVAAAEKSGGRDEDVPKDPPEGDG